MKRNWELKQNWGQYLFYNTSLNIGRLGGVNKILQTIFDNSGRCRGPILNFSWHNELCSGKPEDGRRNCIEQIASKKDPAAWQRVNDASAVNFGIGEKYVISFYPLKHLFFTKSEQYVCKNNFIHIKTSTFVSWIISW